VTTRVVMLGWLGISVTVCPKKVPLVAASSMAVDTPVAAACAAALDDVAMVAVTVIEPEVIARLMSLTLTLACAASAAM